MNTITNFESKVKRIFLKNGQDGKIIKIFENLSVSEQETLQSMVSLLPTEIPIIGGCHQGYCFVLTNLRLVEISQGSEKSVLLLNVIDVRSDLAEAKRNLTADWNNLEITEKSEKATIFRIESGGPLFGLWNAILFVASHNRKGRA